VSVHIQNVPHAVGPLGQVLVAAGRHVVRASVAGTIYRPYGEQMLKLGGLDGGQRCAVNQLGAAAEADAATLSFQRLVVIVTQLGRGCLLVDRAAVKPEREGRRWRSVEHEVA